MAAKKRDDILAAQVAAGETVAAVSPTAAESLPTQPASGESNANTIPDAAQTIANTEKQPLTSSQLIAQQVMVNEQTTAKSTMKSPLTGNASQTQTQPIQVSIVERKSQ